MLTKYIDVKKHMNLPDNAWFIKDMQKSRDPLKPAKYQVIARVMDYYPDSIENFVILRCTNCEDKYVT